MAALVAASFAAPVAFATAAAIPVHYVALGDSRAIGPTLSATLHGDGCGRTASSYPAVVARVLRPASFTSVACGLATTADVVDRGQLTYPQMRRLPPQIAALRADTTLVTLSIGGNDISWRSLLAPCLTLANAVNPAVDPRCRADAALARQISHRLTRLGPATDRVLAAIKARAPLARVVLVGHGGYYGSRSCVDAPFSRADAGFIAAFFARFNAVLDDSAHRAGATFVDVTAAARGHDVCTAPARRWFNGSGLGSGDVPPDHPTPAGSAAIARLVLAALR